MHLLFLLPFLLGGVGGGVQLRVQLASADIGPTKIYDPPLLGNYIEPLNWATRTLRTTPLLHNAPKLLNFKKGPPFNYNGQNGWPETGC